MECLSLWKSAEEASLRAMTTRSHPALTRPRRAASLSLRLILLRVTAFPNRFPTAKPNLLIPSPLGRAINTSSLSDQLRPRRRANAKSLVLVRRWWLANGCGV